VKALTHVLTMITAIVMPCVGMAQLAVQPGPPVPPPAAYVTPGNPSWPMLPQPGLPSWGAQGLFNDDPRIFRAYTKVGYQWMNFDASFPVPGVNPATSVRVFDSMDLQLVDGNVWVGFVGAEFQPVQGLVFFGEMGASALRDGTIKMNAAGRATDTPPAFDANLVSPWEWTAKNFRWWVLDGGVAVRLASILVLEAGFRTEHIDFDLTDPRNDTWRNDIDPPIIQVPGRAITAHRICPSCDGSIQGDPMSKIWDPYLGISGMWKSCKKPVCNGAGAWVMVSDPYIRWRVRGSPWIWNRWYSNIDFHIESLPGAFPESDIHRTVFTLDGSNGRWIEGELEAFLNITPFTKAGFWTRGSWLDVTGTGESNLYLMSSTIISETQLIPLQAGNSNIPNSSFTQSAWSLGLSLDYAF
jgi:hypothetical protein